MSNIVLANGSELLILPNTDRGVWRSFVNTRNPVTHQMFWGGEVSGGHLSAACLLVSMLSTAGARLSSSGRIMASGRQTREQGGRG